MTEPGRRHVPRQRVSDLLDRAIAHPLVLVSAPAGSGKSVALSDWAATEPEPVAWCSLEPGHDDPSVFWPAVASALGLEGGVAPDAEEVITRMADSAGRRVLVLDDLHVVTAPELHTATASLVAVACPPLHLVLATRHDPPLPLARLRADGVLAEVRADHLRFSGEELVAMVDRQAGVALSPTDAGRLLERTEGWAVGVQLAALALASRDDVSAFVDELAGDDRHIADYLRDEVIARVPEGVRTFLAETAILDRLTAPLCEAVTGRPGAQRLLEEVERRNLFLVPLDHRRRWYRYHHLFAEWLRLHPPAGVEDRHRRAADWLTEHRQPGEAIHHLLAAGDADRAADLVEQERWALVGQGRQATLREWTRRLPPEVLGSRPELALASAWIAYDGGQWDEVDHLVNVFAGRAPAAGGVDGALLEAELGLLAAGRLAALGRLDEAGTVARSALALVPEGEPRARSGLLLVLGKSHLADDDLSSARHRFLDAALLARPFGLAIVELIATAHLAEIDRREGRADVAGRGSRAALAFAERAGLAEHAECAVAHLTYAHALLDAGRVEEATAHVERGEELAARIDYQPRSAAAAEARRRLDGREDAPAGTAPGDTGLTGQERVVLRLLRTTLTTREIAGELYLSVNTVKTHVRSLYRKLGVQTRHAALEEARRRQLVPH